MERSYYPISSSSSLAQGPCMAAAAPSPGPLLPFQFRSRHESPDWRRLSAVEVERVSGELDVALLQEHLGHITFCTAERERCPHCQAPADPLLLKLVRLAQLSIEYLLHSQDYLSAQLHGLEETLRGVTMEKDQLRKEATRRTQEIKLLKEECKRRKKMISTQQTMLEAGARYHQCQFCEKAFMNYSFLHSHIQRRHPEESCIEQKKKAQTDKLQDEIDKLKEQLQLTKSQLEAEQHAHMVKFSKEYEEHKSKEEELLQSFHKWKQEEKEKLADEIEKIKEMFMKEFKELTSKNTDLENQLLELQKSNKHLKSNLGTLKDSHEFAEERQQNPEDHYNMMQLLEKQESRWFSKVQALQQEHEKEKHQLLSQIEKLKSSVTEDLNASNIFYKKRIEELGQRLQEQNELIIAQKQQVCFYYCWVSKTMKQALTGYMLEPIEEISEEEKGNDVGIRGIPSDHLNQVLVSVETAREEKEKQVPDIQLIREQLEYQINLRIGERVSCSRLFSSSRLTSEGMVTPKLFFLMGLAVIQSPTADKHWVSTETARPESEENERYSSVDCMYTLNKRGDKMEPCGIPHVRPREEDENSPSTTRWILPARKEWNHSRAVLPIPARSRSQVTNKS
uniref:Cilium assembly protein DZIP1 n=1 Tax=Sphenodon punctatus TaxID=8508 RepID=A0A8D0GXJ5_SPHPU